MLDLRHDLKSRRHNPLRLDVSHADWIETTSPAHTCAASANSVCRLLPGSVRCEPRRRWRRGATKRFVAPRRQPRDQEKPAASRCSHDRRSARWSCRWGLNPWSPHYQCGALPLSYGSSLASQTADNEPSTPQNPLPVIHIPADTRADGRGGSARLPSLLPSEGCRIELISGVSRGADISLVIARHRPMTSGQRPGWVCGLSPG